MALKGNLRDFSITQLLNLVSVARKSGRLTVDNGARQVQLSFVDGKLACARMGAQDGGLLDVLERSRRISGAQARLLRERSHGMSEKELGLMLVNASYISQNEALQGLQAHFLQMVDELFGWQEGQFRFENDQPPPEGAITLRIGLEDLVLDGARRQQTAQQLLPQLLEEIPSLDMALGFVERPGTDLSQLKLSREEWRVLRFVNPKNTLRQIAATLKMSELEIRRTVYSLLQASLVELRRPAIAEAAAPAWPVSARAAQPAAVAANTAAPAAHSAAPLTTPIKYPAPTGVPLGQPSAALAGAGTGFVSRPKPVPLAASQPSRRERLSLLGRLINRIKAL